MAAGLLREAFEGLLDLLYPPKCLVCSSFGRDVVCDTCQAGFRPLEPPLCGRCGTPMVPRPLGLCPSCASHSYYFYQARAVGHYDGPLRTAILQLKYRRKEALSEPLGRFLADYLRTNPFDGPPAEILIPIPLHPARQRHRGFNQSALLAAVAGSELGVPMDEAALRRIRNTRPQAELHLHEREKNVRDAFAVRHPEPVRGRSVLLVDDVLTSLQTVDECARMLSEAGAARVYVAGVARRAI